MDRVAVFVDAGYLFAQGSIELCGVKLTRGEIDLDHNAVTAKLKTFAETVSKLPLLRIYWYDGTSQGPTPQHITLAGQIGIKVRLGFVNSQGQQKGVVRLPLPATCPDCGADMLVELAERDDIVVGRDQVPVGEEAPA